MPREDEAPADSAKATSSPAASPSTPADGPRSGTRGRGGSKSTRPAEKKPEAAEPVARESSPRADSPPGPASEAVEHMVRNYAGVGKRTAEVLVEHFGVEVFTVIDSAPARLTEVLSEGRAKTVIAAREQERAG